VTVDATSNWNVISNNQDPSWGNVSNTQSPNWQPIAA
jgi:hypothetical protein